ncbi:unnamed protein product [Lasius platythorax]|uniref:Uncharacterized protein n=1 Tax=Lasius platythorax TaxID=488582 RepID=A0AAV2PCJ5_9HYME
MPMYFCQRHALIRGPAACSGGPGTLCALATSMENPKEKRRIKKPPPSFWRAMNGKPAICYRNSVRLMGVDSADVSPLCSSYLGLVRKTNAKKGT